MVSIHPYLGVSKEKGYKARKANAYNKVNMRFFQLHINKKTEKSIIKWLDANKPYQTAIKRLILEQIEREKK